MDIALFHGHNHKYDKLTEYFYGVGDTMAVEDNGTTRYLYASSSGTWWFSTSTLTLSTTNSSNVSLSSNKIKVGSYYLRYSGGSIQLKSSATTAYLFRETEK